MREWLSGGAPPCQGGGRGFDPRLALFFLRVSGLHGMRVWGFFICQKGLFRSPFHLRQFMYEILYACTTLFNCSDNTLICSTISARLSVPALFSRLAADTCSTALQFRFQQPYYFPPSSSLLFTLRCTSSTFSLISRNTSTKSGSKDCPLPS